MARAIFGIEQIAQMGMRWFARSPSTHQDPTFWLSFCVQSAVSNNDAVKNEMRKLGFSTEKIASFQSMIHNARPWIEQNGSTIFVDEEICNLCANTESLKTVSSKDIRVTIPNVYFCLPENESPKINGFSYTDCICIYNEKLKMFGIFWYPKDPQRSPIPIQFFVNEDITVQEQIKKQHAIMLKDAEFSKREYKVVPSENFEQFFELTVNFLLVMQSYPAYIHQVDDGDRPLRYSRENNPSVFTLARSSTKTIQQIVEENIRNKPTGTHDSPHVHWRRGHWRRQPHGDEWRIANPGVESLLFDDGRLYHMKWIEPVLISGHPFSERVVQV